jgi:uncharacterized Rmd1/YagE family protein
VPDSEVVPVHAYAFASTFKLRELAAPLEQNGAMIVGANPRWAESRDLPPEALPNYEEAAQVSAAVQDAEARGGPEHPALDELYALFDGGSAIFYDFGAAVFFGATPSLRQSLVAALARIAGETQSPRTDVGEILARTDRITRELAEHGRLRGRVRGMVQFIGSCIQTKNDIIETLALFDKPEATWEQEALDRLYVKLREMLEIDDRFRALEYRLRGIQENLVLLVELSRSRSNLNLELSILVLILVELMVMVWQVLRGRAG